MNPLKQLLAQGQSIWLDYIHRNLIRSGELKRLVHEEGIRGVTSNPTIFEKAIGGSGDYDAALNALLTEDPKAAPSQLYEPLAIEDIQEAADTLRPVYDETEGVDGYVSFEVSPHLAHDTQASISEAKRLKAAVDRPNVMIKVPATPQGIPAIEELIAAGVNVNITLMFSMSHYEAVARAYIRGLERCSDVAKVASVASFFVSRVDTMVDRALQSVGTPEARDLLGKIAVANSKLVYRRFREVFHGEGFLALKQRGARVQRPLWASTGTKNPDYSDVLYVETLIGPETVNTMPLDTLNAFRDHGSVPGPTVTEDLEQAQAALVRLGSLGIGLDEIAEKLQQDGVAAFAASFDALMATLEKKKSSIVHIELDRHELRLGKLQRRVSRRLKKWQSERFSSRLWQKDATLWSSTPVAELSNRLGWLELPETMTKHVAELVEFAGKVKDDGMRDVVLLGMGGSSLAPEVFQQTFGNGSDHPALIVLDSTHPAAVMSTTAQLDLARTLFVVSSKSGTTIETTSLFFYFWNRLKQLTTEPGGHFVAITDPGTPLEALAQQRHFRAIFTAPEDVGGRYSALTVFGLLPAALIGVDVEHILSRARIMREACGSNMPEERNPALVLGAVIAELALARRDKLTFLCSPSLAAFPAWLEQLIAESTGKDRKGIIPIANEELGAPETYGADRFFVYITLAGDDTHDLDRHVAALEANGQPVVHVGLQDKLDLGQEFFRWEVAVAAAGAALAIHPFNQPDVQLAKDLATKAMEGDTEETKARSRQKNEAAVADRQTFQSALASWLDRKKIRDYIALQAYLEPTADHSAKLQAICGLLRDRLGIATTFGYGPRFLHSTGQLHKGGPNSLLALQLVDEPPEALPVPETHYTFAALIQAQAIGDFTALKQRRRRALRIQLGSDTAAGLNQLIEALRG